MDIDKSLIQKRVETKKKPKHVKAAAAQEIVDVVGDEKNFPFGFWLKMIGPTPYSVVVGFLKEIQSYPKEWNKGPIMINKLKKYKNDTRIKK